MLENPSDHPSPNPVPLPAPAPIKRYAHPNQRNRALNRRKSADRSERTNNLLTSDGDKNSGTGLQSALSIDHSDSGSSNFSYEIRPKLIALNGCYRSEASQLLHERWKEAISCYSDPVVDLSERPVMYSGSAASAWGSLRLNQLMSGTQMNFLAELQHAININNNSSRSMN